MQLTDESKSLLHHFYKCIIPYVIGFLLGLILFYNCKGCSHVEEPVRDFQKSYDSLSLENIALLNHSISLAWQLKYATNKIDSLKSAEPKIVDRWHKAKSNGRDSIIKHVCDTLEVLKIYDSVVAKADSLHNFDSTLIRQHELRELILEETVSNRDSLIKNRDNKLGLKDDEMIALKDSFKTKVKNKNKTILMLIGTNVLTATFLGLLIFK